jgi:hypothetical protein
MSTDTSGPQRYAKVRAALGRASWRKDAEHTATAGFIEGRGSSQASALESLAAQLSAMASRAGEDPALWWDAANRSLWIAVTDVASGSHTETCVDMSGDVPRIASTGSGQGPACRALVTAVGMVPVTR